MSEDEYEVEFIAEKRVLNGKVEYLIKWKGFGHDQNSWEPVENLQCQVGGFCSVCFSMMAGTSKTQDLQAWF